MNKYNILIILNLTTEKKLLVSSGMAELSPYVDLGFIRVIRDGKIELMIPGSTIKGVLRTALLRISELLGYHDIEKSIYPAKIGPSEDIACRLFGKPYGPSSKVSVMSTYLPVRLGRMTHVKIRDSTRTALEEGLFSAEYLPIGAEFEAVIRGEDLTLEEAEALFSAIAGLKYERIGRAGMVDVKIDLDKSELPEELTIKSEIIRCVLEVMGHKSL